MVTREHSSDEIKKKTKNLKFASVASKRRQKTQNLAPLGL